MRVRSGPRPRRGASAHRQQLSTAARRPGGSAAGLQAGRGAHRLLERAAPPGHLPDLEPNLRFLTAGGDVESSVRATAEPVTAGLEPQAGGGSDFEVFDDAVAGDARDPYPELALARAAHPVQRLEMSTMPHDQARPVFFVYRYDDVLDVLRDGERFSSAHITEFLMGDVMGRHILVGMDNPEHRRYRALVSTAFRRGAQARWEAELIEPVASELVDRFAGRGRAELVREFTFPYPTKVTAGLLGLPGEDYQQFGRWSAAILSVHTRRDQAIAASVQLKEYLAGILSQRRREP